MFRKIFSVQICLLLFSSNQTASGGDRDSTTQYHPQKLLIIPYEPRMHLSDADLDISEYSERTPAQIRAIIRNGLAEKLNTALATSCQTYSLLQDLRPEAMQEMERIYASIDYSFDTSYAILHPVPDSIEAKGRWNENKARKKELAKRTASGDVKYMNVKILDPKLIAELNKKYGTDRVVFLTQVEIQTKAKDNMDYQVQNYQRDIKLHYAVFDKDGKQVSGDVVSILFPSNSNEIGDIMAKNFPALCGKIKDAIIGN